LPASPDQVFRAWTAEDELKAWWRPGDFRAESVQVDLRVGGAYEIVMVDSRGARQRLSGVYLDVEAPQRLVMTWRLEGSPDDDGYEALLTLEFDADPPGTLLRLRHERLRPEVLKMFAVGWEALLPTLGLHLQTKRLP
jgi:uncharacterized protein YndB with AHSA1/START domain